MDDQAIQFRLGVLIVLVMTVLITGFMVFLFGELPTTGDKTIFVHFDAAPGVTVETPVRKSGILIGRVKDVELRPDGGVQVTARISGKHPIGENEICRISTDNLFGDAVLEFVRGDAPSTREVTDGEFIEGVVRGNPLDALQVVVNLEQDMARALTSIQLAGEQISQVADNVNVLVINNEDQVSRILGKTESALSRFETAMTSVDRIVSDEDLALALQESLRNVPELVTQATVLLQGLRRVASEAERNLTNLRGLTEPLGQQGGPIVAKLDRSAARLDELLQELLQFGKSLNESDGSLAQLVQNPELYQRLNAAAGNIEEVTRRLPPIVNDARVFVDKIARNPRMLGVQGALQRQTSGIK
jgi:phospholipid/cholesterol/gamma-HCH transport system substrate-binding protein